MRKEKVVFALLVLFFAATVVGCVAALSAPTKHTEQTMTTEQMNYFLDRIHYPSKGVTK